MGGDVFVITDTVKTSNGVVVLEETDVIALVDADNENRIPSGNITKAGNMKIVLASSPMTRQDWRWLSQLTQSHGETYVVAPWTTQDLFLSAYVPFTLATFLLTFA
jgi:hypothetical protein